MSTTTPRQFRARGVTSDIDRNQLHCQLLYIAPANNKSVRTCLGRPSTSARKNFQNASPQTANTTVEMCLSPQSQPKPSAEMV